MKLVIGGTFQGKLSYAKNRYHVTDGWEDGMTCTLDALYQCRGVYHFHEFVRRLRQAPAEEAAWVTQAENWAQEFADQLYEKNPEIIIVTNELGYGIVPMDRFDREYREMTGRVCTCLAQKADEVVRVACGLGMVLKTAEKEA